MSAEPVRFEAEGRHPVLSYAEALSYLVDRERVGIKFGLENIGKLAEALGHPERGYRSVLVAGTNGKGSTAALLESILRAAGHRTARYTSPHLIRLEERIVVNGRVIDEEELAEVVSAVKDVAECLRRNGTLLTEPTFFEVTTACAFEFFRRQGTEIAVLEVGMGGRWDATNIAPASMTLITNIGWDHERYLGTTLAAIAAEKAATIKERRPVVTGHVSAEPQEVIRAEAARLSSPLFETASEVSIRAEEHPESGGQRVWLETPANCYDDLWLPLLGAHQRENLAVALRAAEIAPSIGLEVPHDAIVTGVARTRWEARLERISGRPSILIDAAHNPPGALALARYLAEHSRGRGPRVLVFGVMKDKKADAILEPLLPHVKHVLLTRPPIWRARNPATLLPWARRRGASAEVLPSPRAALERARRLAGEDGEVLVAGSLFLAGEIERILREEHEAIRPAALT